MPIVVSKEITLINVGEALYGNSLQGFWCPKHFHVE